MTKFSVVLLVCLLPFLKGLQGCINGFDWYGKPCVHGGFTPFGPFSPCSATCGAGTQTQSRTCTNPAPVGRGKVCVGVLTQERNCNLRDCKVDGGFTPYGDFSACSATCGDGKQTRSRTCTNPAPSGGGNDCVGALTQTQNCKLIDCKVDGGFTPYGDFSACSATCGDGKQTRSRTCTNPAPSGGGNDCVGALTQTQNCKLIDCKVDGGFTPYGDFSACSATCGDGKQTRSRTCTNPAPSGGGNDCVGALTQTQNCKLIDCKVDGGFTPYGDFSACSATCGDGKQTRSRTCTNPAPSGGGNDCVGALTQTQNCKLIDCKVDGGFTPYGDFSACSATCGDGKQTRSRTCTNPAPSGGGNDCVGALTQTQNCKLIDCKVDGGFTPYGDFSACSATCGDGTQTKSRTCTNPAPSGGGNDCVGTLTQTQSCKLIDCKVDGGFSEWSSFSECSATCGDSYKSKERTCTNPVPSGGGKGCVGDFSEKVKCASDRCSGFDFQWNLLAKEACFQGKDDMPAQVQINQDGTLVGIKLVYVNGRIRCHPSFTGSNFGCFTDQRYFNLAITDNNKAVLFPSPNQAVSGFFADGYKNYQYPGYLPTDKEVVFINNNYPTYFRKGDFISIWNYEDLLNNSEGDNSGKVCVDVYAAFV